IGFDLGAGFSFADFLDGAELAVTRVVDCDIDAAEFFVRLFHRSIDSRLVADIECELQEPVAILRLQGIERTDVAGRRRDLGAPGEDGFGPDLAEAFGRAGDEPDLECRLGHGICPPERYIWRNGGFSASEVIY